MIVRRGFAVLIVEDEPGLRLALRTNFLREGWSVEVACGVGEAVSALHRERHDLVLCDVRMVDGDGFEVMRNAQQLDPNTAFLFLTAYGSVPEAVRAMRGGAVDYLTKPVAFEQLLHVALRTVRSRHGSKGALSTRQDSRPSMVGRSRTLLAMLERARAAAETDADVLIEAESGTGKELLAQFLHDNSARRSKPFIAINCAALPESLLESELFGHARGAFTGAIAAKPGKFELAHGGTLLLDEIGEMPLSLQPKLLRALQERVVERLGEGRSIRTDIRVIASTNVNLDVMVERGLFRSDLFFRLNVIPLTLPPLRERRDDLPLLAEHFAQVFAARNGQPPPRLDPSFVRRLEDYHWPGNVRELANFMRRVLSLSSDSVITATTFDREHRPLQCLRPERVTTERAMEQRALSMDQLERSHLETTLELVGGNRTRAAELLGISVRTMRNKIRQYDLPPRRYA